MASARKKQDEKHLKILRELVSLPTNKQCFDCHQRGPTYINMTIGSFVCTSCSGMLRGLTPPHRVKSISMASFSPEEVELIKSRGNEYCRRIWLGLYDTNHTHDTKDEQQIKDFMVAKYEKKRYYLEPSAAAKNNGSVGFSPPGTQPQSRTGTPIHVATPATTTTTTVTTIASDIKPLSILLGSQAKSLTLNVQTSVTLPDDNMFTPDKPSNEFLADFGSADPFSSSSQVVSASTQPSFANFENNPIFNSSSMPTSATLSTMSNSFSSPARKATSTMGGLQQSPFLNSQGVGMQPPTEDRYAALKDLDSLMKTQQASSEPQLSDWSAATSAGNTWSVNGPSIVGGTVYGSPSQAGFVHTQAGAFPDAAGMASTVSTANPFTGTNANSWVSSGSNGLPNSSNPPSGFGANPFRTRPGQPGFGMNTDGAFGWPGVGVSGMPNGQVLNGGLPTFHPSAAAAAAAAAFPTSQSMNFPAKTWHANPAGNPFVLGASPASTGHSSNPFL
ncbi:arf-GAP domain and FG repeat-containing protein 1 isoform X2 [Periplaneta americana]|uniref:arf-GAP domain and FG repeat-containing protein 1 isoform X2 n=1 Tax=Periplaneta americana TaxID=6978 RepID=UPI0037E78339